jgi:hypothetical protein
MVLCGFETWSVTLMQGHRLRVFQNRVAEENIWTEEGRSDRRLEKTA